MRVLLVTAGLIACSAAGTPASAQAPDNLESNLQTALDDYRARYGFPGATAAVALPDGTVITAATGLADREAGRAMTP